MQQGVRASMSQAAVAAHDDGPQAAVAVDSAGPEAAVAASPQKTWHV